VTLSWQWERASGGGGGATSKSKRVEGKISYAQDLLNSSTYGDGVCFLKKAAQHGRFLSASGRGHEKREKSGRFWDITEGAPTHGLKLGGPTDLW